MNRYKKKECDPKIKVHSQELSSERDLDAWRLRQEGLLKARYPHLEVVQWQLEDALTLLRDHRLRFSVNLKELSDACAMDPDLYAEDWCGPVPQLALDSVTFPEPSITIEPDDFDCEWDHLWPLTLRGALTLRQFFEKMRQAGVKEGVDLWQEYDECYGGGDKSPPYVETIERTRPGVYSLCIIFDAN
ncbi:hypothetical protein TSOC_006315 [Tetrabaena socialis]|uniref:Uncharacterized protein n=1 Tax=Tetrabaena socialis TaxID=47790 RepID=A0A2J8A3Y1_9CHLO|nr:hypothetical protein TSOC_006315 [Tetrabaena socialis]|eukprot:PNH07208.1 hypothetical protein TSOC_006315 [Tetrabaena socialis]